MSEHFKGHPEQPEAAERLNTDHETESQLEKLRVAAKEAAEQQPQPLQMDKLSQDAEQAALSAHETKIEQSINATGGLTVLGTQRELKQKAYERKLKQIESSLPAPERSLSKFIHRPAIDNISEVSSHTLFRASGLVGGSLVTLIGSIGLVYAARHYGFAYNYSAFFILFAGGFAAGLVVEIIVRFFGRLKAR